MLAVAEAAGAGIGKPAQDAFRGGRAGYFADPDGHSLQNRASFAGRSLSTTTSFNLAIAIVSDWIALDGFYPATRSELEPGLPRQHD